MNMCNCFGAYPQYYSNYSPYPGYGGSYPQSYPQYGSYEGCCGTYPQYYYYPVYPVIVNPTPIVVNPTPIVVNPTPIVVNPTPIIPVSMRGEYRVGNCLIICNR